VACFGISWLFAIQVCISVRFWCWCRELYAYASCSNLHCSFLPRSSINVFVIDQGL